jgi:hypothetical protein
MDRHLNWNGLNFGDLHEYVNFGAQLEACPGGHDSGTSLMRTKGYRTSENEFERDLHHASITG